MKLRTVDEARAEVCESALRFAELRELSPRQVRTLLFGRRASPPLSKIDALVARSHRKLLRELSDLGYESEVTAELEGIVSAVGLDEGRFDWTAVEAALVNDWGYADDACDAVIEAPFDRIRARASFTYFASVS